MRRWLALVALASVVAVGCGRDGLYPPSSGSFYTLTVSNPGNGRIGVVTPSASEVCEEASCTYQVRPQRSVTLTGIDTEITFDRWVDSSGKCDSQNPCEVVMDGDHTVGAVFVALLTIDPADYSAAATATVSTNVGSYVCPTDCELLLDVGANVTLTASTDAILFKGWGDDCSDAGLDPVCALTLDGPKLATATFNDVDVAAWGGAGDERVHAVAADPTDPRAMIVAGSYTDDVMLDANTPLTHSGGQNFYVARMLADGTVDWVYDFTGAGDGYPHAIDTAVNGNNELEVYVGGTIEGAIDLNLDGSDDDRPGLQNGFLLKLNHDQKPQVPMWQVRYEDDAGGDDDGNTIVHDIKVNSDQTEVWVVGITVADVDFGGGITFDFNQGNRTRMFIAKHDASNAGLGNTLNVYYSGTDANSQTEASSLAIDANDNVIVNGYFEPQIAADTNLDFATNCTDDVDAGGLDGFLFQLDTANEECDWSHPDTAGSGDQEFNTDVAIDPDSGDIYTVTYNDNQGTIEVMRYDMTGAAMWMPGDVVFTAGAVPSMPGLAWDPTAGELVVAGAYDTSITVDGNTTNSNGTSDLFVVHVAPNGMIMAESYPSLPGAEENGELGDNTVGGKSRPGYGASTVAVLGDGSVVMVASSDDDIDLDETPYSNQGGLDGFILRLAPRPKPQ